MKRSFAYVYCLLVALFLVGCAGMQRSVSPGDEALGELPASFVGELPCADCAAIHYRLNLYPDHVYGLDMAYLGQGVEQRFVERGRWSLDGSGETLTLHSDQDGDDDGARMWRVEDERTLEMLDGEGHEIDSQLDYTLKRTAAFVTTPLENTYWKLVRLADAPVVVEDGQREPHLVLHADETRVAGSTGCNRLIGSYQLAGEDLAFGQLGSTMMACADGMQTERAFLDALEKTASWRVLGEYLELYDAEGDRLARFEAVYLY